uniref:Uncharacterized protein n=1 Tax=Arundo donax TaxID=35708 RepID=A0A0A9QEF4_ARUDO
MASCGGKLWCRQEPSHTGHGTAVSASSSNTGRGATVGRRPHPTLRCGGGTEQGEARRIHAGPEERTTGTGGRPPRASSRSRLPAFRRTSSHRLLAFSQELKTDAVAYAKQFSRDLTKRFMGTHAHSRSYLAGQPRPRQRRRAPSPPSRHGPHGCSARSVRSTASTTSAAAGQQRLDTGLGQLVRAGTCTLGMLGSYGCIFGRCLSR